MLFEHLGKLRSNDILVLDRGYPAYWLFAVLLQRERHFCMRADSLNFSAIQAELPPKFRLPGEQVG